MDGYEKVRGESVFVSLERSVSPWENVGYKYCVCLLDTRTEEKSEDASFIPIGGPSAFRDTKRRGKIISGVFISLT